jgi:hypothetical protein
LIRLNKTIEAKDIDHCSIPIAKGERSLSTLIMSPQEFQARLSFYTISKAQFTALTLSLYDEAQRELTARLVKNFFDFDFSKSGGLDFEAFKHLLHSESLD